MNRNYEIQIMFWSDVSIIALESIMSRQGDIDSSQYLNVKRRALSVIKRMSETGFKKEKMQDAVSDFLNIRSDFASNPNRSSVPDHLIPALLVALCVKNVVPDEINDEMFQETVMKSFEYLSRTSD
jgi:hypothetical protein